ncbi:carbon-nitrogen hydrolase family protein [Marinomonas sp. BSi20584]|uniref:carbon-nitrogen hydrolase family protein n=1 Tax=Marinomonas sp. BSi20584 TaxID=1594462 RepID=UPI000C1E8104|nr:carbon-nitrogen hydrolase family protein [Marinomonas sp. BSi20584]
MLTQYKVAAVQAAPEFLNLDAGIEKTIRFIKEAAESGAKLVAFPELWLTGYPWWIWLDTPAAAVASGFVSRYYKYSLSYDDPRAELISNAARQYNINVVLGFSERENGSLYIAQWLIDSKGETIAKRRKLKPTHVERTIFGEGDGSDMLVHDTELGRMGALNCWEHVLPLNKFIMFSQNEQIHVASWPSFTTYEFASGMTWEINNTVTRSYAVEGACFVVAPSALVSQAMIDELCDKPEKHELISVGGGHSVIFGPGGEPLCEKLDPNEEGILYADVELDAVDVCKHFLDCAGHYSRPDVYEVLFDDRRKRIVSSPNKAETNEVVKKNAEEGAAEDSKVE